jgi:hypothetical protein
MPRIRINDFELRAQHELNQLDAWLSEVKELDYECDRFHDINIELLTFPYRYAGLVFDQTMFKLHKCRRDARKLRKSNSLEALQKLADWAKSEYGIRDIFSHREIENVAIAKAKECRQILQRRIADATNGSVPHAGDPKREVKHV